MTTALGQYDNAGQVCLAGTRLLVERPVANKFLERLIDGVGMSVMVGDPRQPGTTYGPLITRQHLQRVHRFVERAKHAGAALPTTLSPTHPTHKTPHIANGVVLTLAFVAAVGTGAALYGSLLPPPDPLLQTMPYVALGCIVVGLLYIGVLRAKKGWWVEGGLSWR